MVRILVAIMMLCVSVANANTINRPTKTFGGSSFINGVTPQASDFNGDVDTIYAEFNGNIDNNNIKVSAAIEASKINPDGFTVNIRTVNTTPCTILDESDQASDLRKWYICSNAQRFEIGTYTNGGVLIANWFTLGRGTGSFSLGGTGGTNNIYGSTTFHQPVIFAGASSILPTGVTMTFMGTVAPTGWLLMDGSDVPCTGVSAVNAALCTQLISLYGSVNLKGAAAANFTVDPLSDEIVHTAHARVVDDRVHFSSTTTLPAPLNAITVYCVHSVTADRFKVKACGGALIDITTSGSGTHSDYFNMRIPDTRGRNVLGTGTGTGLTARTIGATGGEEAHLSTANESGLRAHTHGYNTAFTPVGGAAGSDLRNGWGNFQTDQAGPSDALSAHNVMDPFLVMTYIIKL